MTQGMLRILYQSENFPHGALPDGWADLQVTWDDVLWAAVTVGRPNRNYVFRHGDASRYEAVFRWSLIRMSLEQAGFRGYRLRRTVAAKTLDPTEKGAVNYFLGMTFCKLFASKLLDTPWLLHLDVFRPRLNAVLTGRSRPDLVGQEHHTNRWHAFECKGRISQPDETVKRKAKDQAMRLLSVSGSNCCLHVGSITHFRDDILQFYWCDPLFDFEDRNQIEVPFEAGGWRHYYSPIVHAIVEDDRRVALFAEANVFVPVHGIDLQVSFHPVVAKLLFGAEWDAAHRAAVEAAGEIAEAGYQPDGLLVRAGETWYQRFAEEERGQE